MKQPSRIASISLLLLLSFCSSKQNHQELYFVAIEDFVFEKYRLIELIEGCGNTGEQRHLYVLAEFYGKWVVEDRLSTSYKF